MYIPRCLNSAYVAYIEHEISFITSGPDVFPSLAIILLRKKELVALLIVFLLYRNVFVCFCASSSW